MHDEKDNLEDIYNRRISDRYLSKIEQNIKDYLKEQMEPAIEKVREHDKILRGKDFNDGLISEILRLKVYIQIVFWIANISIGLSVSIVLKVIISKIIT